MSELFNKKVIEPDCVITMAHIRTANLCRKGAQDWFTRHGFPWSDFLTNGISSEKLEATGDPMAFTVVAIARKGADIG